MQSNIQITENKNGIKTIALTGSLSIESNKEFQNSIFDLINSGNKKIILDFRNLSIIDSLGISTLIMTAKILNESGGEFVIINCKEQLFTLLKPIKVEYLVKIFRESESGSFSFSEK